MGAYVDEQIDTGKQEEINASVWGGRHLVHLYARRRLRPAERVLFDRHRDALSGRVLELGCGAGRITGHLIARARSVTGLDLSSSMVAYCRRAYPTASFVQGDLRDLSPFESDGWEAIVAGFNVIDVLDDSERVRVLDELHRLLVPGGLVIMSSHNLACAPLIKGPLHDLSLNPIRTANRLVRLPRSLRNRRRMAPLERVHEHYGIVNDCAHDYSLLHYYITRDGQERQFAEHGFELLECLDMDGAPVPPGASADGCHELHYAARRAH